MPVDVFDHHYGLEIRVRADRIVTDGERGAVEVTTLMNDDPLWGETLLVGRRRKRD